MSEDNKLAPTGSAPGNTKPARYNAGKAWTFTLNNYTEFEINEIIATCGSNKYVIGKEIAPTTLTPHLQGYIYFSKKIRPSEHFSNKRIHWESAKCDSDTNIRYCTKEGDFLTNFRGKIVLTDPMIGLTLKPWQEEIVKILQSKPDHRKIYWYWEATGNSGKSTFAKSLFINKQALLVSGKGNDIKYIIAQSIEKNEFVDTIILDLPRTAEGYLSFSAIEEIKNGLICSGKYESCTVAFDRPHLIILANFCPSDHDLSMLSADRWVIKEIN